MPINILILVDEIEKMVATVLITLMWLFAYATGRSLIDELGWSECAVRFVGTFCFLPLFYGGLATSVMRLLYIKANRMVQKCGEVLVALIILSAWHGAITVHSFLALYNVQSRTKCPNLQDYYFDFSPSPIGHPVYEALTDN